MGTQRACFAGLCLALAAALLLAAVPQLGFQAQVQRARAQRSQAGETARSAAGHHVIAVSQLPRPFASHSAENPPEIVPKPEGAQLNVPAGFEVSTWAEGDFVEPRWLALAPNGDVFVADARAGRILVLRDTRGSGRADQRFIFASGLKQPFGMAFWHEYLYVGNTNGRSVSLSTRADASLRATGENCRPARSRIQRALDAECDLQP